MSNVLFATNCYYKEYDYLSKGGFVYKALLNDYPFGKRLMIINNVHDPIGAQRAFGTLADEVLMAEDYAEKALGFFGLPGDIFVDKKTQVDGYKYSIDSIIELVYAKNFDYICHYCGDTELERKNDWITEGIKQIESGYAGARPKLPIYTDSPSSEQELTETDVFSDHAYLIPVEPYRKDLKMILSLTEPSCNDIHPQYGGNSFERCFTRYLKHTHQKLAIIQSAREMPSRL